MNYDLLWSLLLGLLGGCVPVWTLGRKLRSLELDLVTFETKFLSEQKRKAARERWDPQKDDALIAQLQNADKPKAVRRNPLHKFGIAG